MAGFFVGMGQAGRVMDYSKMKKAQLTEELGALQEKVERSWSAPKPGASRPRRRCGTMKRLWNVLVK